MGKRFKDRKKAGYSTLVGYIQGEDPARRHKRRLHTNLDHQDEVERWCIGHKVQLEVKNGGHHWIFNCGDGAVVAEWWPSSAKLVVDKRWDNGIHVHDWQQAMSCIERAMAKRGLLPPVLAKPLPEFTENEFVASDMK